MNRIQSELGEVESVSPFGATFKTKFVPWHLDLRGTVRTRVIFRAAAVWISIEISSNESEWKNEHIHWEY